MSPATPAEASSSPAATPSGQSAPGPFKITSLSCGKLTAAQQNQFGTTAASGFVYKFTNSSASLTAAPKVSVNFLEGTTVLASNVTGSLTQVSPGQSGTGEVDAVDASGGGLAFKGCQVMSYAVVTSSGVLPQQYAP